VLGTGTAVGKTFVTCAVARALRRRLPATPIVGLKPIETGMSATTRSDASMLETVSFGASPPVHHPLYSFAAPLSPHRAAAMENTRISVDTIVDWLHAYNHTLPYNTWQLVETAGGVFSPLAPSVTNAQLALALEPSIWMLVGADALGVLHDLTATLEAMRHLARSPDLIVLSAARVDGSTGGNALEARELGIAMPVATLGPGDDSAADAIVDVLLAAS
jgi:dethiobiotin synthetase